MASRLTKAPLIQVQRTLAAHAAAKKADASPMRVSKLANGLTVASIAEENGLATIGLSVKAGSRYETYDNVGISHAMRTAIGLSSANFTGFGIARHIQQSGSNLTAYADRELVLYHSSALPQNIQTVSDYMLEAVTSPQFRRWEVPKAVELLKIQVAESDDVTKAVDAFHEAAYRNVGLGNSLICPELMVGKHSLNALETFHQKNYTADRMFLVGMGVEHRLLEAVAGNLQLNAGAGPASVSKYHGGDIRVESFGPLAHAVVGAEVFSGQVSMANHVAAYLLQKILGDGQKIKYGQLSGRLPKALGADGLHAVNGIFFGYSDSVLLGAFVSSDAASVGENVSKVAATLRNISVTDADVQAAKKIATIELAELSFDRVNSIDMIGYLHHFEGDASATEFGSLLDTVSTADVKAVAKKLSNAKLAIGASGNCGTVPYPDTL